MRVFLKTKMSHMYMYLQVVSVILLVFVDSVLREVCAAVVLAIEERHVISQVCLCLLYTSE